MTDRVVIFGVGLSARLAHFYLSHDSDEQVVAFTVDRDHATSGSLNDIPVVPFDEIAERYPAASHRMFVALGYGRMNTFRASRYQMAKDLGYELISYVSSRAGRWPDTKIGDNCFIMEGTTIQPFVEIGDDVTIWSTGHVGQGSVIGDHTFISSQAVISSGVTVGPNCFIGVNATIAKDVRIGREVVIGAGAHITESTADREVYAAARGIKLAITSDRLPMV